jgi:hypothetical protein
MDEKCSRASIRADPLGLFGEVLKLDEHQPAGTNCLIVMVSVPTGKIMEFDALAIVVKLSNSTVIDQNDVVTGQLQDDYGVYMSSDKVGSRLVFNVPKGAISFTLVLPDGRKIPLTLAE